MLSNRYIFILIIEVSLCINRSFVWYMSLYCLYMYGLATHSVYSYWMLTIVRISRIAVEMMVGACITSKYIYTWCCVASGKWVASIRNIKWCCVVVTRHSMTIVSICDRIVVFWRFRGINHVTRCYNCTVHRSVCCSILRDVRAYKMLVVLVVIQIKSMKIFISNVDNMCEDLCVSTGNKIDSTLVVN